MNISIIIKTIAEVAVVFFLGFFTCAYGFTKIRHGKFHIKKEGDIISICQLELEVPIEVIAERKFIVLNVDMDENLTPQKKQAP